MRGWSGRVLHIDMSSLSFTIETPGAEFYREYLGGRGACGYYYGNCAGLSWDDEQMRLIIFRGPLAGTTAPGAGWVNLMTRSPLTGTVADGAAGGLLGTALQQAGWDGLVISGRSSELCGLEIDENGVLFSYAEGLRGAALSEVKGYCGDYPFAAIGPASEHGSLFGAISVDNIFQAGRGGGGLVMAHKGLKYLVVKKMISPPEQGSALLEEANVEINRLIAASPFLMGESGIAHYGTAALYDLLLSRRALPAANFRATYLENGEELNAWHFREAYGFKASGCPACPVKCLQSCGQRGMPGYESLAHFSALIGNRSREVVLEANRLCSELGMEPLSAAATLASYSELKGVRLSGERVLELLEDMAHSRGEGAALKLGAFRYASALGRPECAMTVKGLELPPYDPRGAYGMALSYATANRGGCHLSAYPIAHEILRKPVATDRFSFSGKGRIIKIGEDINAAADSLGICKLLLFGAGLEEYSKAFEGVTGVRLTGQELMERGERVYYRERIYNWGNGFSGEHDTLPGRFFSEEGSSGEGIRVAPLKREEFLEARANYYKVRGLDSTGRPRKEIAERLGVTWRD